MSGKNLYRITERRIVEFTVTYEVWAEDEESADQASPILNYHEEEGNPRETEVISVELLETATA